jgi:hypothetical protein
MPKTKNAVCVIGKDYNKNWISFLAKFKEYDTYFVVDNNSNNYKENTEFPNVSIIQIDDSICSTLGYTNMCNIWKWETARPKLRRKLKFKTVGGWEKAVYYFANINTSYNHVWFVETDLFFKSERSFMVLDNNKKHQNSHLIIHKIKKNEADQSNMVYPNTWWWPILYQQNHLKFTSGFFHSLPTPTRASKELLSKIKEFATTHNNLFFLEALFLMICKHNNLSFASLPKKMSFCQPSKELHEKIKDKMFDSNFYNAFFHPIKNTDEHVILRKKLNEKFNG